ncbi:MAG: hypothetical protein LBH43_18800 [Treponema sp.]|jgi:hypothetical protein|nr:hypothetical protein [Treponema sp.]
MKRMALESLLVWKDSPGRKPLINPPIAIRSSLEDLGQSNYPGGVVYDILLYMIGCLPIAF